MTRVSESSSIHAINHAVSKTKGKVEDLQLKGSNLKRITKPSDDPLGNMDILSIRSKRIDGEQYLRNISVAKAQLMFTENAVEQLTEVMSKAKELAIGQASNFYDPVIRKSIAEEVGQLRNQALSIGNRRFGNKYIFAGFKSLSRPFSDEGKYLGDTNQTKLEVGKDFFIPVNFSGDSIFMEDIGSKENAMSPLANTPLEKPPAPDQLKPTEKIDSEGFYNQENQEVEIRRTPASANIQPGFPTPTTRINTEVTRGSVFNNLKTLQNALLTNNHEIIQDLLPELDKDIDRLIRVRTKIGSVMNSIDNSEMKIENDNLLGDQYRSKIEDADVAQLFADLTRQQNVLSATYRASSQLMKNKLIDYLR